MKLYEASTRQQQTLRQPAVVELHKMGGEPPNKVPLIFGNSQTVRLWGAKETFGVTYLGPATRPSFKPYRTITLYKALSWAQRSYYVRLLGYFEP